MIRVITYLVATVLSAHTLGQHGVNPQETGSKKEIYLKAEAFLNKDQLDSANYYWHKLHSIAVAQKDTGYMAMALEKVGTISFTVNQTNTEEAEKYFHEAAVLYQAIYDTQGISSLFFAQGNLFMAQNKIESGLAKFKESYATGRGNNPKSFCTTISAIGACYYIQGETDSAAYYLREAVRHAKSGNCAYPFDPYNYLIALSLELGNLEEARELLDEMYHLFRGKSIGLAELIYYENLHEYAVKTGDNDLILESFGFYRDAADSLMVSESNEALANLRIQYDVERKEANLLSTRRALENQQLKTRLYIVSTVATIALLVFLFVFAFFIVKKSRSNHIKAQMNLKELQKNLSEVEQEQTELELNLKNNSESLLSYSVLMFQQKETIRDINAKLQQLKTSDQELKRSIIRRINEAETFDKDWTHFQQFFDLTHPGFEEKLKLNYSDLTETDRRLCHLLRLNMSSKQIAVLLKIESKSVDMARYRLRKKLGFSAEDTWHQFLNGKP